MNQDGLEYIQLQSEKGTILIPAGPDLNRESLKEARCTEAAPIAKSESVLTKAEYEVSKRIKAYSGIILTTIKTNCAPKDSEPVPYGTDLEVGIGVESDDGDQRTSIFSRQNLPAAIKGVYDPNIGVRVEY